MWMGPVLFIAVNLLLWRYGGAVFVPEALARLVFSILPVLREMETVILINTAILYFGASFTREYAIETGSHIYPNNYAVWVEQVEVVSKKPLSEQV